MNTKYIIPFILIVFIIIFTINKTELYPYASNIFDKKYINIDWIFGVGKNTNNSKHNNTIYNTINNPNNKTHIYMNDTQKQIILIEKHFSKLYDGPIVTLGPECEYVKYTKATIDEILKININHVSKLVLSRINYASKFKFVLIEYTSVQIYTDIRGNKRYIIDMLVDDPVHLFGTRLLIDVVAYIFPKNSNPDVNNDEPISSEHLFPNTYPGYPTYEQLMPLPTDIIVTGRDVLSTDSININKPDNIYALYLNYVKMINSDLTLNALLDDKLNNFKKILDGVNTSQLESSLYTDKFTPYIEPAIERNKWPTLNSQPKNQMQYPCTKLPFEWDKLGIFPEVTPTAKCPGINHGTTQQPLITDWWYSTIGVPRNSGQYYWMFDLSNGIPSNAANYNI